MSNDSILPNKTESFHQTRKPSVFLQLALELRCQPSTAKGLLLNTEDGIAHKVARIIRVLRRGDFTEELARFWAPILAAYEDRPLPRTLKQLRHRAQIADSSEDLAESLVMDSESPGNLRRWAAELREEAALGLELADAAEARARELADQAGGGDRA